MARKTKGLKQRDTFVIFTNGKETEKNYFTELRDYRHSIYDIKIKFESADPKGLLLRAIKELKTANANKVWIVFDKDEFPDDTIYETIKMARQYDIGIAFSNIAFEVWLISHFKKFNAEKKAKELLSELDSILKENGYRKGYEKNDSEVFKKVLFPKLEDAMHNANISLQKRIAEFNEVRPNEKSYPYCDWNSCTTVHKLIEDLKIEI
ncbi:RloB family protein [Ruminococcus sp. HUN007]|uniref:RloB family protein n=1 Tax=Ruminococcus sp. HUN007 TaxID=1514668 RepID=UPI0005D20FD7|nr:RloB family protein [Ruminococcus sp. HUN007]